MESAKPIEPGCKALTFGFPADCGNNNHIVTVIGLTDGKRNGKTIKGAGNSPIWEIDHPIVIYTYFNIGEVNLGMCRNIVYQCPECNLMRIDDDELQQQITREASRSRPKKKPVYID